MRLRALSWLTACLLGQAVLLRAEFTVPALTGAVVDNAGMLSQETRGRLDSALRGLWQNGGSQIAVLTVPDLGGEAVEAASIKVTDAWKLGDAKKDNGVLLMLSKAEHKIRIEVGQGLEGELTDAYCSRIIRQSMVPLLRQGRTDEAVLQALGLILAKSDPNAKLEGVPEPSTQSLGSTLEGLVELIALVFFFGIFGVFMWLGRTLGGGRRGGWGGGGFGGGGFGGGGGFSGGGGGFSGGGSSGSW